MPERDAHSFLSLYLKIPDGNNLTEELFIFAEGVRSWFMVIQGSGPVLRQNIMMELE